MKNYEKCRRLLSSRLSHHVRKGPPASASFAAFSILALFSLCDLNTQAQRLKLQTIAEWIRRVSWEYLAVSCVFSKPLGIAGDPFSVTTVAFCSVSIEKGTKDSCKVPATWLPYMIMQAYLCQVMTMYVGTSIKYTRNIAFHEMFALCPYYIRIYTIQTMHTFVQCVVPVLKC